MAKMEFIRGDGNTHYFTIPADSYSASDVLHFKAKPEIDDDTNDSAAQIVGTFNSSVVTDVTENGVASKKYTCYFPPSATSSISTNGESQIKFLGEFQVVPSSGDPQTFPGGKKKIDVVVYPDIIRSTS